MYRKKIGSKTLAEEKDMGGNTDPKHKKCDALIPRQMVKT
jgi:hypothetical protein